MEHEVPNSTTNKSKATGTRRLGLFHQVSDQRPWEPWSIDGEIGRHGKSNTRTTPSACITE